MNVFTQTPRDQPPATHYIEIVEPELARCPPSSLPLEGHVKLRNYRLLNENIRAYTPTSDTNKDKLVPRYEVYSSPPRSKILELLRPEDPGRDALEAIVRPVPRRGLSRPLDEDTRRFLQRALQSPGPLHSTPESHHRPPEPPRFDKEPDPEPAVEAEESSPKPKNAERSLADELREAEEEEQAGGCARRELLREFQRRGADAAERERLARLALAVEDDEAEDAALSATARRLDALLAQSRDLHAELAHIHADLQASSVRARRCTADARALGAEARALRYLDDVVALLRGDVAAAVRAKAWPFAIGRRQPGRNYII